MGIVTRKTYKSPQNSNIMLNILIPKEIKDGETRVAATAETVKKLIEMGASVVVEAGAGKLSYISDDDFKQARLVNDDHEYDQFENLDMLLLD